MRRLGCLAEVQLLQSLPQHPNVVACYDAFWDEDANGCGKRSRLVLVLEYGDCGDLDTFIQTQHETHGTIALAVALGIFAQTACGLAFLHERHVLHRDIKSKNVFRFRDGRIVIGDFGTCKSLAHTTALATTLVGSPLYMSPELLDDQPYSFSSDVWSLGCILYELVMGRTPFMASSYPAVVFKITKGVFDPLPPSIPAEIHALVARMLSLDPTQRPTVREILEDTVLARCGSECLATASHLGTSEPVAHHAGIEVVAMTGETAIAHRIGEASQPVLPPPAPVAGRTAVTTVLVASIEPLPAPPPPSIWAKPRTRASALFPTHRARLADILSRERLHVHKNSLEQRLDDRQFLSCVPMQAPPLTRHHKKKAHRVSTKPTASNSSKPRTAIPPDNLMIIGTKVSNAVSAGKHEGRFKGP